MARRVTPPARLPLRFRLANPPRPFVGRQEQVEALARGLTRGPVVVVHGVGGLGKSALVRHALHERFPDRIDRVVALRAEPEEPIERLLLELLVAIASVERGPAPDPTALPADGDALVTEALDRAEGPGGGARRAPEPWWVVIEDLHLADAGRARELLRLIVQFARESRWVVTTRDDLGVPELLPHTVRLGTMPDAALAAMASAWSGAAAEASLIAEAGGSPWRLQQLLAGHAPDLEPGEALLDALDPDGVALLRTLLVAARELPPHSLARAAALPAPEVMARLQRRGWVERTQFGLRLHDAARPLLSASPALRATPAQIAALAEALAADEEPVAQLEALRLYMQGDAFEAAGALLARAGDTLAAQGLLPSVARLIGPARHPALASARLACVVRLADSAAARHVVLPPSPSRQDRLRWATALWLRGDVEHAFEVVEALALEPVKEDDVHADAAHLAVRAALRQDEPARALALLEQLDPHDPTRRMSRDISAAVCLAVLGRGDEALARIEAHEAHVDVLEPAAALEMRHRMAWLLERQGLLLRAEAMLATGESEAADAYEGVMRLCLRWGIAYQRGQLADAGRILARLGRMAIRTEGVQLFLRAYELYHQVAASPGDDGADLVARLDELLGRAASAEHVQLYRELACLRLKLAQQLAEPVRPELVDRSWQPEVRLPVVDRRLALRRLLYRAHQGESVGTLAEAGDTPEHDALRALVEARRALAGGDASSLEHAVAARDAARAHGHGIVELEAQLAVLDAVAVTLPEAAGASARLAREADTVRRLATAMGVAEAVDAADFLAAAGPEGDPGKLERLAGGSADRVTRRRARMLLSAGVTGDAVDARVLAAIRRVAGWRIEPAGAAGEGWRPGWGLDVMHQRAWLPDGRSLDLSARLLAWRLLLALVESPAGLDKEQLVAAGWEEPDYHPLRHDNRLHTAIRKLRQLLEDDANEPRRVVTTEEGYALGDAEAVRVARAG